MLAAMNQDLASPATPAALAELGLRLANPPA